MLAVTDKMSLFITGFDTTSNTLSYRFSDEPERLIQEPIKVEGENIYTKTFSIPIDTINTFIKSNEGP